MTQTTDTQASLTMDPSSSFEQAMDWLHKNTNFPTFEQFKLNPDKWRTSCDEIFESIENLNVYFKNQVHSVKYYWRGEYECKTLGKLFDICKNEGYNGSQIEMEPIAEPMDGTSNNHDTRVEIKVNVWPKHEFKAQGGVVSNG